jgi:DnaJ-class molecular chaperone
VEAYSVLRDPASRSAYDSALAVGHARLSPQEMERVSRAKRTKGQLAPTPRKLGFVDSMSTPEAKEVAERIERLVVEGRYAQAYQQISLLQALEPDNKAIHERSTQLAALARKQASRPYSPK